MNEKSFLFVKLSSLGDVLQTLPCAAALKAQHPGAVIDWVVDAEYADLLTLCSDIDRVIALPIKRLQVSWSWRDLWRALQALRRVRYDIAVDFQGNTKSGLVTLFARARTKRGFARGSVREWPNLLCSGEKVSVSNAQSARERYAALLGVVSQASATFAVPQRITNAFFLLAPFSRWRSKMLPLPTWKAALEGIGIEIVCGSQQEAEEARMHFPETAIHIHPSYEAWIALTQSARGVFCVDSSALHLATALGTPTFSVFGPSSPEAYASDAFIWGECPFSVSFTTRCPYLRTCASQACVRDISPKQLAQRVHSWLAARGQKPV